MRTEDEIEDRIFSLVELEKVLELNPNRESSKAIVLRAVIVAEIHTLLWVLGKVKDGASNKITEEMLRNAN